MKLLELLLKIIDEEWSNIKITFAQPWEIPWLVYAGERDDYEIYFLEKGKGRLVINNTEYPIDTGETIFFHTKQENSFIADEEPFRFIFVTFKVEHPENCKRLLDLNNLLSYGGPVVKMINPQRVQEILYQMQREFCLKSPNFLFKVKLLLGQLVSIMNEQHEYKTNNNFLLNKNAHNYINRVIIYIQNNFDKNISLEELGSYVNLHPRYLCTLFKQVSGKTISTLLREIRIEKAKRLLLYSSLSITEVAMEVGFCDSQYFSRIFSESEGVSPTRYRKSEHN